LILLKNMHPESMVLIRRIILSRNEIDAPAKTIGSFRLN
jgi:hypothetical protein